MVFGKNGTALDVANRLGTAVMAGDFDGALSLIAPDAVDHSPLPGADPGHAGWRQKWTALAAARGSVEITLEQRVASGDIVASRYALRQAKGDVSLGFALDMIRVKHGRVVEHWSLPLPQSPTAPGRNELVTPRGLVNEPLLGSVALVTGAARGLGEACARALARDGATVIVADILKSGESLAKELGGRSRFIHLDVSKEAEWSDAISGIVRELGRLDVLVNNAGIACVGPTDSFSSRDWSRVISVNQTGVFFGIRAVLPTMLSANRGSIVNIASIEGIEGAPATAAYCASKHAVIGLTRSVALEVAKKGIRVNCVCPGVMMTAMMEGIDMSAVTKTDLSSLLDSIPMGRAGQPHEAAELVSFLASNKASYCTGAAFFVDGGWTSGWGL